MIEQIDVGVCEGYTMREVTTKLYELVQDKLTHGFIKNIELDTLFDGKLYYAIVIIFWTLKKES